MPADRIESLQNPRIKELVKLRNRRERDRSGTFLIEGFRELTRAVRHGVTIRSIYHCPEMFLGSNEEPLIAEMVAAGADPFEVSPEAFRKASYRDRPEGLIAVAEQFDTNLRVLELDEEPLLLVVEAIEKPGNLGTMLRTADAAGADAVVVTDPTTDPFNPNVVRASLGCLFTMPLAVASTGETIEWLRAAGIRTVATTPDTPENLWDTDLTGPVAVVIGSEQYGLSRDWLDGASARARIPMAGSADSLNAAMAAGIALFEVVRQRGSGTRGLPAATRD